MREASEHAPDGGRNPKALDDAERGGANHASTRVEICFGTTRGGDHEAKGEGTQMDDVAIHGRLSD
jgi:hypothetical protein